MNGLQLLAEIEQSRSCTQVAFLTGCGDVACGIQAMREGAVDYLEKPVDDQRRPGAECEPPSWRA